MNSLADPIAEAKRILHAHFSKYTHEWTLRKFTDRLYASSLEQMIDSRPYVLFSMQGGDEYYDFFCVVYSKILKRSLVLIPPSLLTRVRVHDLALKGTVEIFHPLFEPKEELIHMLYFLIRFHTQDHSTVYRDRSFLIAKPELEQALWLSWQGRAVAREQRNSIQNILPNRVNARKIQSLVTQDILEESVKRGTIVILDSRSNMHISVFDAVNQVTYGETQIKEIHAFLRQWYLGSHGSSWFPPFEITPQELADRIEGVRETLSRNLLILRFEIPFFVPELRYFLRGRVDPQLRGYLEGKRDLLCDTPEYSQETVAMMQPMIAQYGLDALEYQDESCLAEDEPHVEIRTVSVLFGMYSHLLPRFFHFLFALEGNLEQTIDMLGKEQDLTNDTMLLFCIFRHLYQGGEAFENIPAWIQLQRESNPPQPWIGLLGRTVETSQGTFVIVDQLKSEFREDESMCMIRERDSEFAVPWEDIFPSKTWRGGARELVGWRSTVDVGETVFVRGSHKKEGIVAALAEPREIIRYRTIHISNQSIDSIEIDSRYYDRAVRSKQLVIQD